MNKKNVQIFFIIILVFNSFKYQLPIILLLISLLIILLAKIFIAHIQYKDQYIYFLTIILFSLSLYNIINTNIIYVNTLVLISIVGLELLKKRAEWLEN